MPKPNAASSVSSPCEWKRRRSRSPGTALRTRSPHGSAAEASLTTQLTDDTAMVEDYLTDRDQEEALRNWWRENWKWILAGVALGLGLLAAYQYWQTYRDQRATAAAKVYADMQKALTSNDLDQANRLLTDLGNDYAKSGYTQQGHLLLAKRDADAGKFEDAIKHLRAVVATSDDDELAQVARLRLARLLIQTGKHDDALQLLNI